MKGKLNWNKWSRVTVLLALASLATMGFTVVDRSSPGATISADHIACPLLTDEELAYIPQDLYSRLCADHSAEAIPSLAPVLDSTASWMQYSAAMEREDRLWNERALAEVRVEKYGGDWFDVYGNASGILELELADPLFANR